MKDERGIYYYPYPSNRRVRMYVRADDEEICFRLWNADDPALWLEHGWVPYSAIQQARKLYTKKGGFDPNQAYDINVARALLKEKNA